MDEAFRKLAALGLPGVILIIAMASTGLAGAAAITAALAMLGPGGMLGGVMLLGVIGLATDSLAKYGLDTVLVMLYKHRLQDGGDVNTLTSEVSHLPISSDLKRRLKEALLSFEN